MYTIEFHPVFSKRLAKIKKKDPLSFKQVSRTLEKMQDDPFQNGLRTHRVTTRRHGYRWSTRVTGDLRIIWDFDNKGRTRILTLTLGGHSGRNSVYK